MQNNPTKVCFGVAGFSWREKFYNAVMAAPVPYDMRALRALKRSPLALDVYAVLNYRAYTAKEPIFLSWQLLMKQLGSELGTARNFQLKMVPTLRKVLSVQPHLKVVLAKGGLLIHPSRASIAPRLERAPKPAQDRPIDDSHPQDAQPPLEQLTLLPR